MMKDGEKEVFQMSICSCECCGKRTTQSHCLECHAEICDMPTSECVAKQRLIKKGGMLGMIYAMEESP